MDFVAERSAPEFIHDNELATTNAILEDWERNISVKANGSSANEIPDVCSDGNINRNVSPPDISVEGVGMEKVGNSVSSQLLTAKSPGGGSPSAAKGFGLRKWRRIKRDVVKDAYANADISKALKRVLPGSMSSSKSANLTPVDIKPSREGSVGSVNTVKTAVAADGFVTQASSLEARLGSRLAFTSGAESEISDGQCRKSSTAANAPETRYDLPAVVGYALPTNRAKNLNGDAVGNLAQHVQQGKGRLESSKKPRGEKIKIKMENSHSSTESDSRSSNFVFTQGNYSVTSNGIPSGITMNYGRENSDEANVVVQQFGDEICPSYVQENFIGEIENLSEDGIVADASWNGKEERNESHQLPTDENLLLDSVLSLQSVQEALEHEVRKLGEIGKVSMPEGSSSFDLGVPESSSPDQFDSVDIQSSLLESQVLSLTENIKHLESSLEEANGVLKVKESRVAELEATMSISLKEESENTSKLHLERCMELETDVDSLFKQKIEAEVEYIALTKTIQKLKVAVGEISLFEQQEALTGEQVKILNKVSQAESKVATLRKCADKLEEYSGDILETEEVLKMQGQVFHGTYCFLVQMILLILAFWLVVLQLSPHDGVVVPT